VPDDELMVRVPREVAQRTLLRRSLRLRVRAPAGADVSVVLDTADLVTRPARRGVSERPHSVALARARFRGLERTRRPHLRLGRNARRGLRAGPRSLTARVRVTARLPDGRLLTAVRLLRVTG
jgi:hypothetical protein